VTLTLAPVPAVKPVVDGEIGDYTGVVAFMGNNRARVICIAMLILYSPPVTPSVCFPYHWHWHRHRQLRPWASPRPPPTRVSFAFMGNNRARVICIAMLILYSPLVRVIPRVRPSPTRESFAFMGNEKARI